MASLILLALLFGFHFFLSDHPGIGYNTFLEEVRSGRIKEVFIKGPQIEAWTSGGRRYRVYASKTPELISFLKRPLKIYVEEPGRLIPGWVLPLAELGVVFLMIWVLSFWTASSPSQFFSFVRSRARLVRPEEVRVRLRDVVGVEEAKEELWEVVEFLKDPQKFARLGGRIPKGILLVGHPETGKTLLAKAIAGEAFRIRRDFSDIRAPSEKTAREIDEEIENIIRKCYENDRELLSKRIKYLHILAETLLEVETIDGDPLKRLLSDLRPLKNVKFS